MPLRAKQFGAAALGALVLGAGSAHAAQTLTKHEARQAVRTVYQPLADLVEGHLHIGKCRHLTGTKVICNAKATGPRTTCTAHIRVSETRENYNFVTVALQCGDAKR
jgi:hypothetical protein